MFFRDTVLQERKESCEKRRAVSCPGPNVTIKKKSDVFNIDRMQKTPTRHEDVISVDFTFGLGLCDGQYEVSAAILKLIKKHIADLHFLLQGLQVTQSEAQTHVLVTREAKCSLT